MDAGFNKGVLHGFVFDLSALSVRHWRANTEGKACTRCIPRYIATALKIFYSCSFRTEIFGVERFYAQISNKLLHYLSGLH